MNLILGIGDWFAQNWMIIVLIVVAVALLVPTYLRQKKEMNARNELNSTIKKGTKIITTAGVYGVVESIEETSDGKVVTISTGNSKNPSSMTIHINAIGGIDNKTNVIVNSEEKVVEEKIEEIPAEITEDSDDVEVEKPKKTTKKKTTTKSK